VNRFVSDVVRVARPVEVDVIGSERLEGGGELSGDLVGRPQSGAQDVALVAVTELGGEAFLLAPCLRS